MSASLGGAIKAYLETKGLGIEFHREKAPQPDDYPYGTVNEGVSRTPSPEFNQYDDPQGHTTELVTVNLWQLRKDPTTKLLVENPALCDLTTLALQGARPTTAPFQIDGMRVVGSVRVPDPNPNVVHDAITVAVARTLARSAP